MVGRDSSPSVVWACRYADSVIGKVFRWAILVPASLEAILEGWGSESSTTIGDLMRKRDIMPKIVRFHKLGDRGFED